MLTKEHLKYRVRQGRVTPVLVEAGDRVALATAADLVELFRSAPGRTVGELESAAEALVDDDVGQGFIKLLVDACEVEEDDGSAMDWRWRCLEAAQELRRSGAASGRDPAGRAAFRALVAAKLESGTAESVGEALYDDLPSHRAIKSFRQTEPAALLDRYNVAQVQGLLLRARNVVFALRGGSLAERRELFRMMRFHRLIARVSEDDAPGESPTACDVLPEKKRKGIAKVAKTPKTPKKAKASAKGPRLAFEVSGPLGIFDQAATYGMRLANFFPHLLRFAGWELEAEVNLKGRQLTVRLDASTGLKSHYTGRSTYVPEEFHAFVEAFNKREHGMKAAIATEFLDLGRESYCFPDMTISRQDGKRWHVELFHRWHAGALEHRLATLEKSGETSLLVGVSRSLAEQKEVAPRLEASAWFRKNGFLFGEFPTPKAVEAALAVGKT